jgi:hypothetical protein
MYCNDNSGYFPTCAEPDLPPIWKPVPEDWIHWQANRNLDDSALAKYLGRGDALKRVLRCPADDPDSHGPMIGISPGQGIYQYSYGLNLVCGTNYTQDPARTKVTQWRSAARKIMYTEPWEKYAGPHWSYGTPLTRRHGTTRLHKDAAGSPELQGPVGANVSAAFVDGHAESIDQDFAFDHTRWGLYSD